jgi:hypothetical protein
MRSLATLLIAALPLLLAGCESKPSDAITEYLAGPPLGEEQAEMQALIAAGAPRMAAWLLDRDQATSLLLAGERNGVTQWRALDNARLYFRDGVLIQTRGLGHDLMTTDLGNGIGVITSGQAGQITRIHRQLDGQDRLEITSYVCDILPMGRETIRTGETSHAETLRVDEQCFGPAGDFENRYWLQGGQILQSEQIFNRDVGRLRILFLH